MKDAAPLVWKVGSQLSALVPHGFRPELSQTKLDGAMSSCSIQPRVNRLLGRNCSLNVSYLGSLMVKSASEA